MFLPSFAAFLILGTIAHGLDSAIEKENVDPADIDLRNVSRIYLKYVTINTLRKSYFKELGTDALKIRIENSQLDEIDVGAFDGLEHLNALDLINDRIKELNPETFSRLPGLEMLNLDSNDLTNLTLNVPTVQELVLSNNSIETVTEDFLKGRNLMTLDLSFNEIQNVGEGFSDLEKLDSLDLSYNHIEKIEGSAFSYNKRLVHLNVSGNILSDTTGLKLESLTSLDLSDNVFVSLNSEMFEGMINLEYLIVKSNAIKKLNDPFVYLNNLQDLDLSDNEIEVIDSGLFRNNFRLEKINFMGNHIKKLSTLTMELKSLFYFDVSHNAIADVDLDFFKSMSRVVTLDLSCNHLTNVNGLFDPLKKLNKLNLALNNVSSAEPFTLKNEELRSVNLSGNSFDLNLSYFKTNVKLSHIDLSDNKIVDFCAGESKLNQLIDIDLSDNLVNDIKCFKDGEFQKLDAVDVRENPLTCGSDLDDTIHYLAVHLVSPWIVRDSGDDIMNVGPQPNETLSVWNSVKREICPDGLDIHILNTEDMKESIEDSDSSDSNENASQILEDVAVDDGGLKLRGKEKEEIHYTYMDDIEPTNKKDLPIEDMEEASSTPTIVKKIELNIQSQRNSWNALQEDQDVNDIEIIDEDDIKRTGFTWYTVALVLIGISLTLVCVNVAGFMYLRSRSLSNNRGGIKFAQTYTQLNNDVYRDTTEPMRTQPQINNDLYSSGRTNKIFLSDQIQELLLNFGLFKKGEEDSESVKKMIVNTTSNSGVQQC